MPFDPTVQSLLVGAQSQLGPFSEGSGEYLRGQENAQRGANRTLWLPPSSVALPTLHLCSQHLRESLTPCFREGGLCGVMPSLG